MVKGRSSQSVQTPEATAEMGSLMGGDKGIRGFPEIRARISKSVGAEAVQRKGVVSGTPGGAVK